MGYHFNHGLAIVLNIWKKKKNFVFTTPPDSGRCSVMASDLNSAQGPTLPVPWSAVALALELQAHAAQAPTPSHFSHHQPRDLLFYIISIYPSQVGSQVERKGAPLAPSSRSSSGSVLSPFTVQFLDRLHGSRVSASLPLGLSAPWPRSPDSSPVATFPSLFS